MSNGKIDFENREGLAKITLNRPKKLNSLSIQMFQELMGHIEAIEAAPQNFGCVLLKGAGACFSAGNDMEQIKAGVVPPWPNFQPVITERLSNLAVPVVVAVHGHCYTGALELALAGDIILASSDAKFADTHSKWGLVPRWGMSQRLPRRVGYAKAMEMMTTCRAYTGAEAETMGLANACYPAESFEAEVDAFCQKILANSWFSHQATKKLIKDTDGMSLPASLAHNAFHHPGPDPKMPERMSSFLDKKRK